MNPRPATARHLAALALLALALPFAACERREEKPDVVILHTGRLLGNVFPQDFKGRIPLQHYRALGGYIRQARAEAEAAGAEFFLFDSGDSLGGSFASHATGSRNMVAFFNAAGYDAVALGNLDSDLPADALAGLEAKTLCPFAGPDGQPAMPGTSFAALVRKGEHGIRLLANFHGDLPPSADPLRFPAWFGPSKKPASPLRDYAPIVAALGEPEPRDLTLFSWMKFESPDAEPRDFLAALARLRVDAILAHRVYGRSEKDVWRQSASAAWSPAVSENILRKNLGFSAARIDLAHRPGRGWVALSRRIIPMTSDAAPPDPAIDAAIAPLGETIKKADAVVGQLAAPFSKEHIYRTYLAALSRVEHADALVYSPESIRDAWPAGELRASAVFGALPWTSGLHRLELRRDQLAALATLPQLSVLVKRGEPETLHVVTSEYFAALIARHLGLDLSASRDVVAGSEYDFFLDYLQKLPSLEPMAPDADWSEQP